MPLLKDYIKSQILKLEGTKVQEIQAKSNILVQYYFKISKADVPILNLELRYKGSFTPQPQFQAVITPEFQKILTEECLISAPPPK